MWHQAASQVLDTLPPARVLTVPYGPRNFLKP
ncbi:hypothetical protein GXY_11314 [Novacetimonas hansenii ATCC 23769]|uniref:Uncharacterized protein n=1 Tax=Novacetimonas hansenii ATCC 23769 TaxID=714995 RepID=D5QGJ1_NOVHA|nr:hypothetical protein GXY_11314 [Novacetimonas hansenii ATCC 23769]